MWIYRLLWQSAGRAPENPPLLRPFLALHSRVPVALALGEFFRSDGCCPSYCKETRCPTECQLKYSDTQWMCSVWLQLNTANGSPLPNPQKIPFGEPITKKSEVTEHVRRAQRAILSPLTSPDIFLSGADTATECSFSENRIVLHISGPDVDGLNFIDLPGSFLDALPLFINIFYAGLFVGGDKEGDMQLVRNLAISYIEKPSCLILLTVACESTSQFENRRTFSDKGMQPTLLTRVHISWHASTSLTVTEQLVCCRRYIPWGVINEGFSQVY